MVAVGLRRYLGLRPTAFTVRFPGQTTPFDEFDQAGLTARTLGIDHEPIDLEPEFIAEHLAWMVRWFDGPFSYAVHTANLSPIVGHDRLVSGAGGDAWGLTSKERTGLAIGRLVPRRTAPALLAAGMLVGSLHVRGSQRVRGVAAHSTDLAKAVALDLESGRAADVARSLVGAEAAAAGHARLVDYYRSRLTVAASALTPRQQRFHLWARVVDPDDSVGWTSTWGDAYGIRAVFPYLDPALAATLAEHVTDRGDRSEFRSLAAEHLPPEASHRPKVGQSLPLAEWFRTPLRDFVESVLAPDLVGADGLVDPAAAGTLVARHMTGACDHRWDLLKLMTLLLWKRQVFDPAAAVSP
jgi:asparagine synthase (glutamine-hydrolysing)